jgi:hypothetical protein
MGEQEENLERVYSVIAPTILVFKELRESHTFHMEDLRQFVIREHPNISPDSPSRILRDMRQKKVCNYVVLNRHQSLYMFCSRKTYDPDVEELL